MFEKLMKLADAYENALENDYCESGEWEGNRPDEIALAIIREIREQTYNPKEKE